MGAEGEWAGGVTPARPLNGDVGITEAVKAIVFLDPELDVEQVEVTTRDGVVTLGGAVPSEESRRRLLDLVWRVPGVRQVVDRLRVRQAPEAP